jgi:hypothetical protein
MDKQAFAILEFDELRALVRRGAQTDMARRRIEALEPLEDLSALHQALREVAEAQELRQRGARLSFQDVADPAEAIARLKIAGTALEPLTILELVKMCVAAHDARSAVLAERENCPTLFGIVATLPEELKKLANSIHKKVLPNGEIDDRASPELVRIRHGAHALFDHAFFKNLSGNRVMRFRKSWLLCATIALSFRCARTTAGASTVLRMAHLRQALRSSSSRCRPSKATTNCRHCGKLSNGKSPKFCFKFRRSSGVNCRASSWRLR